MRIRIKEQDEERPGMWFNDYVGETFEVLEVETKFLLPAQYCVDVSELVSKGRMAKSSRGRAYVPVTFVELVNPD